MASANCRGQTFCLAFLTVLLMTIDLSSCVTIMSIDFGSEWIKIAVVAPGVPMEIVLNKESKRKTPSVISFRDGERSFGEDAITSGTKSPAATYQFLLDLLGKKIDNPVVDLYRKHFPYYKIEPDPVRQTVMFRHDANTTYTVEELVAQILHYARDLAVAHTGQRIQDIVITVPPFFNQAERRAMLAAADLAGLKVLSLISSNAAVALNHGMFRRKEINATAQNILFYDMGASSTTATIVSCQTVKTKDHGYTETNPQLTVLGVGYDRMLGGLEMQLRLRDFLAQSFDDMKLTSNSALKSPRAMAKLMKEAARVKNVLSANTDHVSQVEGVLDDKDFALRVTREKFEELCSDMMESVSGPVDAALVAAAMDIKDIHQFIIVGGNTRVPMVQSILQGIWGKELGKNINADEAAAMGAVYRAADLGQGFKVKKFHVREAVIFPVEVDFERTYETEAGNMNTKVVKRSLFAMANTYPQKKVMTFNKHTSDFGFSVNYGDLSHLRKQEIAASGLKNLTYVLVGGVTSAFAKHMKDDAESKGIKAHFNMDDSGVLTLAGVEAVFEKNVTVEVEKEEESTLSKIGSTLSKLFSGADEDDKEADAKNMTDAPDSAQEKKEEKTNEKKTDEDKKTKKDEKEGAEKEKKKEVKPRLVTVKEELNYTINYLDLPNMSGEQMDASKNKLKEINAAERMRHEKAAARNALESYILDVQEKLWQEDYEAASMEEVRATIRELCSKLDDWLYGDGFNEEAAVFKAKLGELETLFEPIRKRVYEHHERPEALQALNDMINMTSTFLHGAQEAPEDMKFFTDVELATLDKLIIDTQKWLEEKEEEQEKTALYEDPKLTLSAIGEKIGGLDREIKYLVNKAKITKAKKEKEAAEAKLKEELAAAEEKKKNASANATESTSEEQKEDSLPVNETSEYLAESEKSDQEDSIPFEEESQENDSEADKRKTDEDTVEKQPISNEDNVSTSTTESPDSNKEDEQHIEL